MAEQRFINPKVALGLAKGNLYVEPEEPRDESRLNGKDLRGRKSKIWHKTKGHCWYCGKYLDPFLDFSLDHFQSKKNGGANTQDNLVPCCRSCNSSKGHRTLEAFRAQRTTPRFSDEQVAYLVAQGVDFEAIRPPPHQFYFEIQGLRVIQGGKS